jgi:acylphosphatase
MALKRARLLISGRVQGVWYRRATYEKATRLGLRGWVRNLPDGRVEILAEGAEGRMQQLELWCHDGPQLAEVTSVEVDWNPGGGTLFTFGVKK